MHHASSLAALFFLTVCHAAPPPPLPVSVTSFGAAAMADGAIFAYGGHSGQRHKYHRDAVSGSLFHWRAGAVEWSELPAGEPAQGASLIAVDQALLRIGGMAARNAPDEKQRLWSTATVSRFDLARGVWTELPAMPRPRSSHDSTLAGGKLYVIGGWHMQPGQDTAWHDSFLTLDLARPEAGWQALPQPFQRRGLAVQSFGKDVYALGGMNQDDELLTAVSVLDTTTGEWREGPSLPDHKLAGFGFAAVVHEGRLFASGAAGDLLELTEGRWHPVTKLRHPRYFHRLLPAGPARLIALGGEAPDGKKAPPEEITLPSPATAASAATPPAATVTGSDWPRYQGPRGDSTTPEVGWRRDWPADGPPILWQAELGASLGSFAVAQGRVYAAGNDGADQDTLWCFDLESGRVIWRHSLPVATKPHQMPIVPPGPAATPTAAADRTLFLSREGHLLSLDAATGTVIWQRHLINDLGGKRPVYGYSTSPSVHKGRIYLDVGSDSGGAAAGSTACLDAATGKTLWQTGQGEAGYATPFVTGFPGNEALVLFKGAALELRNPEDGTLLASHATQTRDFCNCATPLVFGDTIFISHTGNMGARGLRRHQGELTELWTDRNLGLLFHSGIPWRGRLLAFNDQLRGANDLRLLDPVTGKSLWQTTEIERGSGLAAEDHAIILTNKGELILAKLTLEKLDILHRVQVLGGKCWAQPVLSQHRLLVKNNAGQALCLDLRPRG